MSEKPSAEVMANLYDATLFVVGTYLPKDLPEYVRSQIEAAHEGYRAVMGEDPMSIGLAAVAARNAASAAATWLTKQAADEVARRKLEAQDAAIVGQMCKDCGTGPLIFSCREIGDGLCHPCGHKRAAKLEKHNADCGRKIAEQMDRIAKLEAGLTTIATMKPHPIEHLYEYVGKMIQADVRHSTKAYRLSDMSFYNQCEHLMQESAEVKAARNQHDIKMEMGDVLGVLLHMLHTQKVNVTDLCAVAKAKLLQRFEAVPGE